MRRDIGRHADRDAVGTVDQQVGETGGKDLGFLLALVIVGLEVDRVLVDIVQQQHRGLGEAHFRVPHRRGIIAVHRAEIALPVDQRQPHGKGLRHPHHGVVDRAVAMRMVFTHDVTDDAGGFAIGPVRGVAGLMHAEQDAPMHRLQPVARVGQSARHDHAHGIVEVGASHLLLKHHRLHVSPGADRGITRGTARRTPSGNHRGIPSGNHRGTPSGNHRGLTSGDHRGLHRGIERRVCRRVAQRALGGLDRDTRLAVRRCIMGR